MSGATRMSGRAAAFLALLAALPSEAARLRAGVTELATLLRDLVRAAVPPNPQFERERIIAQARSPRELVFLLGLLSEGENEAALLLELIDSVIAAQPGEPIEHMLDEAWYYLRTSIDAHWQLDEGEPSAAAALAYLFVVLTERLDGLRAAAPEPGASGYGEDPERAVFLRELRDDFTSRP
jgi:anti-sigma factor RsiW